MAWLPKRRKSSSLCASGGDSFQVVVLVDPLDGSSNIDVMRLSGLFLSIAGSVRPNEPVNQRDFLQAGHRQVAVGYIIYGSSTMLVYSTGSHAVNRVTDLHPGAVQNNSTS